MSRRVKDLDLIAAHIGVFNRHHLRRVDPIMVGVTLILGVVGLLILYSASRDLTSDVHWPYYVKQTMWLLLGAVLALVLICIDFRVLISLAPVMYLGAAGLLVAVLFFGHEAKGGQHWLAVGSMRLQPSELSKVAMIYSLAWYLAGVRERIRQFPFFALALAIGGFLCGLILRQGDLGTAVVLIPILFGMVFLAGARWWHFVLVAVVGVMAAPVVWSHLAEHQKDRIRTFVDLTFGPQNEQESAYQESRVRAFIARALAPPPDEGDSDRQEDPKRALAHSSSDTEGNAWQTIQSKIAVGSGRMSGKGWRNGTQTHLRYLPEYHTDFIFSLLAEENGFVGSVVVLGLFAVLLLRGLGLAQRCPDMSGSLLAAGSASLIACHLFINVAVTIGLLPVTGLPLPFLSYGGSFCLTTMICIGAILSVNARKGLFD